MKSNKIMMTTTQNTQTTCFDTTCQRWQQSTICGVENQCDCYRGSSAYVFI